MENSPSGKEEVYPRMNSAFLQFNHQLGAHLAAQSLAHREPYRMMSKYTDVAPEDIIWSNLNLNPYEAKIRLAISYPATAGYIDHIVGDSCGVCRCSVEYTQFVHEGGHFERIIPLCFACGVDDAFADCSNK